MGSKKPALTSAEQQKVQALAAQGVERSALASRFRVSRTTINTIVRSSKEKTS